MIQKKIYFSVATILLMSCFGNVQAQIAGDVTKMIVADGKLIIGGQFEKSDRRIVNNVTVWDGTKLTGIGKGVDGKCHDLVMTADKNLFVAGDYSVVNKATDGSSEIPSNRIAKWNGTAWASLGSQTVDRDVFAVAQKDNKLYIGGNFTKVGGNIETKGVAMHDGKKWSAVGNAKFDRAVLAMAFLGNDLYVGGIFTINGDEPAENFAKWDGKAWSEPVNGGIGNVTCMASDGKNLYVGTKSGVKVFDGKTVTTLKGAPEAEIYSIFLDGSKVYISGDFDNIGKKPTGHVALFDGGSWTAYPEIPYSIISAVAVYNNTLYVGGKFEGGIRKWDGKAWVTLF
jgi:hypothetical protein